MFTKQCTILIPTQDRDLLLYRAIKYYEGNGFNHCNILILDSSREPIKYQFKGNFKYLHLRNVSFCSKILKGIKKIQTKYVVISNDDDFIACNGLKKGINFLNNNKNFSSYHGEYIFFRKLEKINFLTYSGAYEDTLANKLQFTNKKIKQRIIDIYTLRPHWYNALHYKKYLCQTFKLAEKGSDLHFAEYVIPLVVGSYGYLKVDKNFWYAKDSNIYKDLSILSIIKKKNSLREILNNNSKVKILMINFLLKKINKITKKNCTEFIDNIFINYFSNYFKKNDQTSFQQLILRIRSSIPLFLKNIIHIIFNLLKNGSLINSSFNKYYGPMKNQNTKKDWFLIKKNLQSVQIDFSKIYKNLK